jgi:hypothetical protein
MPRGLGRLVQSGRDRGRIVDAAGRLLLAIHRRFPDELAFAWQTFERQTDPRPRLGDPLAKFSIGCSGLRELFNETPILLDQPMEVAHQVREMRFQRFKFLFHSRMVGRPAQGVKRVASERRLFRYDWRRRRSPAAAKPPDDVMQQ